MQEDLRIYLKRAGNAIEQCELESDYSITEAKKDEVLAEAKYLRNQADNHFNAIAELNREIAQSEQNLMHLGGAWASSRKEEQEKINQLISEKASVEANLITYLEGDYVFGFAKNTMDKLLSKAKESSEWQKRKDFSNQLTKFLDIQNSIIDESIKASLQSEATKFIDSSVPKDPLEVTEKQISILEFQNSNGAKQYLESINLKQKLCEVELKIDGASINVARAPEEEQLKKSVSALRELEKAKSKQVSTYKEMLLKAKEQFKNAQDLASKLAKLQKEMKSKFGDSDSALRASRSITLLQDFDIQLTALKVKQISENFGQSYKKLARKEHLNIKAQICPKDFSVSLIDENGSVIDKKGLSAGEKQIFAIAMIDALASVAGKTLPLVIDTPLGRLDSEHRDKLVEHYFPHASEQVVILSTDTEIGEEYLEKLSPYVSHKYDIHFDTNSNTSEVSKGYFHFLEEQSA